MEMCKAILGAYDAIFMAVMVDKYCCLHYY